MVASRFTLLFPEFVISLILADPIGLEDYREKVKTLLLNLQTLKRCHVFENSEPFSSMTSSSCYKCSMNTAHTLVRSLDEVKIFMLQSKCCPFAMSVKVEVIWY
jgi:hypothetical protein